MIEIPLKTQLVIGVITVLVFYLLIKQMIKNISSTDGDGDTIIDLNKMSRRGREKKKSE
jgi:FtsH-binding integral membrane protein|tara:strand:+ start:416 stop:592 length:177 start_codon:yes stop_codon:yes gene_type:complete